MYDIKYSLIFIVTRIRFGITSGELSERLSDISESRIKAGIYLGSYFLDLIRN